MEIIITTEDLFKENSPVGTNVVLTEWQPYMLIVQKIYMRKILGVPLITELQLQIAAAQVEPTAVPYPITPANKALLNELAPVLAFYTIYQGLPFQWAKIQNKGVTALESENSKALAYEDIAKLRRSTLDDAERLATDLIEYLCRCSAQYPLWAPAKGYGCKDRGIDCGDSERETKPFQSMIHIPKARKSWQY